MLKSFFWSVIATALISGCAASSHVIVGTVRPAIAPQEVKIYLQPPPSYEEVAIIDASSRGSGAFTDQRKMDKAIARLKSEAAALGANGVLLQGTEDRNVGSVGFGSGTATASGNSAIGTGLSIGGTIHIKAAQGLAIFVKEGSPQ
jgi:hypothetical protein